MIVYLTFGDSPSGVYWSQVTDVVKHLRTLGAGDVRLVAMVSGRVFGEARRAIRERCPGAIVLPHVPSVRRWRWNRATLACVFLALRPTGVICRGVHATDLALWLRKQGLVRKVCFDARGAYAGETAEYLARDDHAMTERVRLAESAAIRDSDFRMAVSGALVDHWRAEYGYEGQDHVVIPCTLSRASSDAVDNLPPPADDRDDVRLVFCGGTAGWQSFASLQALLEDFLDRQRTARVVFLSPPDPHIEALARRHPGRVEIRWVPADRMPSELAACDVGILIRDDSMTNRVASPVKFAEYLAAGLRVVVSDRLGDVSDLVRRHDLGWVCNAGQPIPPLPVTPRAERQRMKGFAQSHWTKAAHDHDYRRVFEAMA